MNLRRVSIIFRKELLDTLRDRKTLIFMIALPMLLMPGLVTLMTRVTESEAKKTKERILTVQAEPEDRDRLVQFLKGRIAPLARNGNAMLSILGDAVRLPLQEIATDLKREPFDILLSIAVDPTIRNHARAQELRDALAASRENRKDFMAGAQSAGIDVHDPESPQVRELLRLRDLIAPLTTIEYVAANDVTHRPATHSPLPDSQLPDAIRANPASKSSAIAISERRVAAALHVPLGLDESLLKGDASVEVDVVYDSTIELSAEAQQRIEAALNTARELATAERLAREELPATFIQAVTLKSRNLAPPSREVLKAIASFLPYILILMSFVGGLYTATDLGAGEKERLTLETLLVSPASRFEIALGKFGVVFLASMIASILATGSMAWTFTSGLASKQLTDVVHLDLHAGTVLLCLALIAPLAAIFASVMLSLSIYAKSQKEAQSLMVPLQFVIIIPAMLSMIPTIELNPTFACIPIINVALALRMILTASGAALPWLEIAIIFGSTTLFAALTLLFCARQFSQEKVIFRS